MKVLITTIPFAEMDRSPIQLLGEAGIEYVINPFGRKMTETDLLSVVEEFDVIIAGTESITEQVFEKAKRLKLICRVGIGLDSVDLLGARNHGVCVTYTPDAPSPAVAELTIALILSLLRSVQLSNLRMHGLTWHRHFGRRLKTCTVGLIGVGRIGRLVIRNMTGIGCARLMLNDLQVSEDLETQLPITWSDKDEIYREADVISLHVPLTSTTRNMIDLRELEMMKPDACLINTARGGIINEEALYQVMSEGKLSGAAIDVFEKEPYDGALSQIDNCLLTAHMGSMSVDCRMRMEIEATEEVLRFASGRQLLNPVPSSEYEIQSDSCQIEARSE